MTTSEAIRKVLAYGPAYQHMHSAMRRLVSDDAGIRKRLTEGWYHFATVAMIGLNENDPATLPDWLLEEAVRLREVWGRYDQPQIPNAIDDMSDDECREEAENLWEWYDRLLREMSRDG